MCSVAPLRRTLVPTPGPRDENYGCPPWWSDARAADRGKAELAAVDPSQATALAPVPRRWALSTKAPTEFGPVGPSLSILCCVEHFGLEPRALKDGRP
jgi:hypothetical protein